MGPDMLKSIILFITITAIHGANAEHSESYNLSIPYLLYTPEHPEDACFFEPNESNNCTYNPSNKLKILIHGEEVKLSPGNFFEQIKDTLLEYNDYNVIIVNWTKYNGKSYFAAKAAVFGVGMWIVEMINFLVKKGVNPSDIHIIGHSLGAHVAGVAGKEVSNMGRITGLDPSGHSYTKYDKSTRLTDNSAELVDVIHTTYCETGVCSGLAFPIGSIDFYPNGGSKQPGCEMGNEFRNADAEVITITSLEEMASCYHNIVLPYFMNSIHLCNYTSVECESYEMYSEEKCDDDTSPTNRMGLFCELIPELPAESKFFLNTSANAPYCEKA